MMFPKPRNSGEAHLARAALELVRDPVFLIDARRQRILDLNQAAGRLLPGVRDEWLGRPWPTAAILLGGMTVTPCGEEWLIAVVACTSETAAGTPLTRRDPLTGLADRGALTGCNPGNPAAEALTGSGLLFIDLDNFKRVNDTWGHPTGDRALQGVAQRLCENVRPNDLVIRYGGDEFLVLVTEMRKPRDLRLLARRIAKAVSAPLQVGEHVLALSASIGIAAGELSRASIEAMIVEADRAMYEAKRRLPHASLRRPSARYIRAARA